MPCATAAMGVICRCVRPWRSTERDISLYHPLPHSMKGYVLGYGGVRTNLRRGCVKTQAQIKASRYSAKRLYLLRSVVAQKERGVPRVELALGARIVSIQPAFLMPSNIARQTVHRFGIHRAETIKATAPDGQRQCDQHHQATNPRCVD